MWYVRVLLKFLSFYGKDSAARCAVLAIESDRTADSGTLNAIGKIALVHCAHLHGRSPLLCLY